VGPSLYIWLLFLWLLSAVGRRKCRRYSLDERDALGPSLCSEWGQCLSQEGAQQISTTGLTAWIRLAIASHRIAVTTSLHAYVLTKCLQRLAPKSLMPVRGGNLTSRPRKAARPASPIVPLQIVVQVIPGRRPSYPGTRLFEIRYER
jgi:hypothetical protein